MLILLIDVAIRKGTFPMETIYTFWRFYSDTSYFFLPFPSHFYVAHRKLKLSI